MQQDQPQPPHSLFLITGLEALGRMWSRHQEQEVMNKQSNLKLKEFLRSQEEQLDQVDLHNVAVVIGEHLHFNGFSFLARPLLPPCLSRSLSLLDWMFLFQKQFSIIMCSETPQCGMQMLLTLATRPGNY